MHLRGQNLKVKAIMYQTLRHHASWHGDKGKGYRDKPDHSTNSAIGRVVGLIPITLPLVTRACEVSSHHFERGNSKGDMALILLRLDTSGYTIHITAVVT